MLKRLSLLKASLALLFVLLAGCASFNNKSFPYDAWSLDFFVPDYMEAWIETAVVIDIKGKVFYNAGSGIPARGYPRAMSKGVPAVFKGKPAGWRKNPGGKGRYVRGADLPHWVYVRWQSMAEPQTYEAYIEIAEPVRQIMRKREEVFCKFDGKVITDYRELLIIGLAPGGIAKVWVGGPCLKSIEATRVQAHISREGPNGGTSNGKHRPLLEESKAYIEKFGIPYGSW